MATISVEYLSDELLDQDIPCQLTHRDTGIPCGQRSVARIRVVCSCNQVVKYVFACFACLSILGTDYVHCVLCGTSDYEWSEI